MHCAQTLTEMAASTYMLTFCVLKESDLWLPKPRKGKIFFFFLILRLSKIALFEEAEKMQ